jgi:hypothetical protein
MTARRALGFPCDLASAFFGFETAYRATLDCIPMSMRAKLDRCRLKLSLAQWRTLPLAVRETLREAPVHRPDHVERLSRFLRRRAEQSGWSDMPAVPADAAADIPGVVSEAVSARCIAGGRTPPSATQWAALAPLQRYALIKLAGQRSGRNWNQALAEFGIVES